jgi:2,3-bisphosphoglycerate-dependent phosphoglycerate mutase
MTTIYFVRHAQPEHNWDNDRTRPLTDEGRVDARKVTEALRNVYIDRFVSSPYQRSVDTIKECALEHGIEIVTDERLREREKGAEGNNYGMFQKRWCNFDFHEDGGESLNMVQRRNIEAVFDILKNEKGSTVVVGTHGTALSTILNYYEPSYGCDDFLRIIDYMPYIIRLDFEGQSCLGREELLIVKKKFKGEHRADKKCIV